MVSAFDPLASARKLRESGAEESLANATVEVVQDATSDLVTRDYFDARLEAFEARADARFEASEARMDARFEAFEARADARFEAFESRFEAAEARADARFEAFESRFDAFESRFEAHETRTDARFEASEARTDAQFATVRGEISGLRGELYRALWTVSATVVGINLTALGIATGVIVALG